MDLQNILENKGLTDALIRRIADEVIRRINNKPKSALVIFSGAAIGFKQELEACQKLKEDGWELKVFLSDAAMKIFTPDMIAERLGVDTIYNSQVPYSQRDLYQNVDQIIIAATTVNTAAKIACGICDNDLLTLVNHGIMAGTDIVCCVNGACPDDAERAKLGMGKSPEGYRKKLKDNFRTMISFGITLCTADHLYETCLGEKKTKAETVKEIPVGDSGAIMIEEQQPTAVAVQAPQAAPALPEPSVQSVRISKHVISSSDVRANRHNAILEIPADALVTQSAQDLIHELGIGLRRA